jgi:hypothetical protein
VLFSKEKTELIQYPARRLQTSYTIPESVTAIGEEAFAHCKNLTSIAISKSVKHIGDRTFYGCESLKDIVVDWNMFSRKDLEWIGFLPLPVTLHVPGGVFSITGVHREGAADNN